MNMIYVAMDRELLAVSSDANGFRMESFLTGKPVQCLTVDPGDSRTLYCGTFGEGLLRSRDSGRTWESVWSGIEHDQITSVAVGSGDGTNGTGVVYAGTEPSHLYRSEDGGESWRELAKLRDLPSSSRWSFPPRPYTSHVRWIEQDPARSGALYVCIEAGALVRSFDGGETWVDRTEDGPFDTHTLRTHPGAEGRLYSAAGDGYLESTDGGDSWTHLESGLKERYCWSVAVHPADPDAMVMSVAASARYAHNPDNARSSLYRRQGKGEWQEVSAGWPESEGTLRSVVAADESTPGVFYAANNKGIFRSMDGGPSWERLELDWPERLRTQSANAIIVLDA